MSIRLPKIFLDSGNPEETKRAKGLLGHLEGQTTNPTLVAKHPEVQKMRASGQKLTQKELLAFYKQVVQEIGIQIAGSISVEVYANWDTTAKQMLSQAEEMYTWGKHIHIKFPTIPEGLKAAHEFTHKGGRVNMTLVFDQNQAAAVYAATLGTNQTHFVSPFIGRWDDRGTNGLDLLLNILKMYKKFDKQLHKSKPHVEVLAASIRTLNHLYASIFMGADIVTIPLTLIQEWVADERWMPDEHYRAPVTGLKSMVFQNILLKKNYEEYKIKKEDGSLLDEGLEKFVTDWNNLLISSVS